jgi:hypothetical protein
MDRQGFVADGAAPGAVEDPMIVLAGVARDERYVRGLHGHGLWVKGLWVQGH